MPFKEEASFEIEEAGRPAPETRKPPPCLYVVATPIGNMEDITLRALRVLGEVSLIAAEDTRATRKLLSRHGIRTPLISYHRHNVKRQTPKIIDALAKGDVALVSDAGAPTLSDPGQELVRSALDVGVRVVPLPGPSAVAAALSVSGLPADRFVFVGFLPRRRGERRRLLQRLAAEPETLVVFETPHRVREALDDMRAAWGDRRMTVCRELTKLFEEVTPTTVAAALEGLGQPRGEFTLVVEGAPATEGAVGWSAEEVREELVRLRGRGARAREAVSAVAEALGAPRREVYRQWLALGPGGEGQPPQNQQ